MVPLPCTEQQLCGLDLNLLLVTPSVSATDHEPRYRCPVGGCQYLGATLTHPGDCLRHLMDPKVGNRELHQRLLAKSVVSFRSAEGKPVLNSRANIPSAILYCGGGLDGKSQYAYMKVGGNCSLCNEAAAQTCSCCPRSLCLQHQIQEALNTIVLGHWRMFVCQACQLNPQRVAASNMHHYILDHHDMVAQELFTAAGDPVSKYRSKKEGAVVSAETYSTQCFLEDIAACRAQGSSSCTRWVQAGKRPGRMYWLRAGTVFESKAMMAFAGVHSLQQQVYFYQGQPALAILVQQPVQDEMKVACTGPDVTCALRSAHKRMIYVRIVSRESEQFTYHGVWLITSITEQSAESAQLDMISMPDLP